MSRGSKLSWEVLARDRRMYSEVLEAVNIVTYPPGACQYGGSVIIRY